MDMEAGLGGKTIRAEFAEVHHPENLYKRNIC